MRVFLLMAMFAAMCVPLASMAQLATQAQTFREAPQMDLAAMTLRPADVARIGLTGFGLAAQSSLRDAEAESTLEGADPEEAAEILAAFQEEGFLYQYVGSLLRPKVPLQRLPSGFVAAEQRLNSSVTEYSTAEGAKASFALFEGAFDEPRGSDIEGTRVLGDESELTRSTGKEASTRQRYQRLELTFRLDNLIGEVNIVDFDNVEPEVATIEKLADLLLIKIVSARIAPGPELSSRVLRVTPLAPWIEGGRLRDYYVRLAGRRESTFAQLVDAIRASGSATGSFTVSYGGGALLARDTYLFWTPVGEGEAFQLPLYVSWIDRYDSPEAATAAIRAVRSTDLGPGYVNVRNFTEADEQVGDDWRMYGYVFDDGTHPRVHGYVMMSRIGNIIVRVQADAPNSVNREGVVAMARLQAACVEVNEACVPVPAHWLEASLATTDTILGTPFPPNN
jgi:hypothetical protein